MYSYIYDSFLHHKQYDRILSLIEARLIEIGINGKITRLSMLTNMKDSIENAIRHGAKNVVAVGNDQTFSQAMNTIANFPKIVLGFIPIGESNENIIAQTFSIINEMDACDILSARIIRKFPLGKINDRYFFFSASILSSAVKIECDKKYFLTLINKNSSIHIINIHPSFKYAREENNKEPNLHIIVEKNQGFFSQFSKKNSIVDTFFPEKKIRVTSKERVNICLDEHEIVNTPAEIEIVHDKIQVIIKKNASF